MKHASYKRLSIKTFFILLLHSSLTSITITFIWFALVLLKTTELNLLPAFQNSTETSLFFLKILDLSLVFGIFVVLVAWLISIISTLIRHLTFYFKINELGITIKQGLLHKTETSTPYRHIDSVNVDRPLLYQLLGMSQLHILTGDEDGENRHGHMTEIEFPVIELSLADEIRNEILTHIKHVNNQAQFNNKFVDSTE